MRISGLRLIVLQVCLCFLLAACGGGSSTPAASPALQQGGSIQGTPLALAGSVTTWAGTAPAFTGPTGVATDNTWLYVADRSGSTIRKMSLATGAVTTIAGMTAVGGSADGTGKAARFQDARGVATDGTNLYVADSGNHTIRKVVIATGVVTTIAGTAGAWGAADGTGAAASFNNPAGIATDGSSLYVTDNGNHTIRRIVLATGVVTTLAGSAGNPGSTDDTGAAASFNSPLGVATDGTNLYVVDSANNTVRQVVIATGVVTTLAGTAGNVGSADDIGAAASFNGPTEITTDGTNLFLSDAGSNTIRKIEIATGVVTTTAGTAGVSGSADGTGAAASFSRPTGVALVGSDNLYVADQNNSTIRKVVASTGAVTTVSENPSIPVDSPSRTAARFSFPSDITTDGVNLYIADYFSNTIRKAVIATGAVTTIAGSGAAGSADGNGTSASFSGPSGITTDGTNLFVADFGNNVIRKVVIATGAVSTLAGTAGTSGPDDGTGAAARFFNPRALTTDGTSVYVADTENHAIRKIVIATGVVTTFAGTTGVPGSTDGTGTAASFMSPAGITTDGTNLYVADTGNLTFRKIVISSGAVTTLAGTAGNRGSTDAVGAAASFGDPQRMTTDGTTLFVTDGGGNNTVRKIVIATGAVTTIAGTPGTAGGSDGIGAAAEFDGPAGITTDGHSLYVADTCTKAIRKID